MRLQRSFLAVCTFVIAVGALVLAPSGLAQFDGEAALLAAPIAVDDTLLVKVDSVGFISPVENDTDADDDPLTVTGNTQPAHGTVDCEDSFCTYTPASGYTGLDGFDYTVSDGTASDQGHVAVQVVDNLPPEANDDFLNAKAGVPANVNVLENDFDSEGDELTVTTPTPAAAHGTVLCQASGQCTYNAAQGFQGQDSFEYSISDGQGGGDTAAVSVSVALNQAPEAENDTAPRAIGPTDIDVLANDFDPNGDELTITAVSAPAHGTVAISADEQAVTYTATGSFQASDSFTYTVSDGFGGTDTATVTLTPCAPIASAFDENGIVTSERWEACSSLTANGQVSQLTPILPPSGDKEALFTSGDVANAPGPNDDSGAGTGNSNKPLRGAFDVSILRLDVNIPAGSNCLAFDLAFQSEEYPEYVNQSFNDGFLAELDVSDWVVNEDSTITAPHNFAFDVDGGIVSVNSSFFDPGRVIENTGSEYDGSTALLNVQTPVTAGAHVLYLSIFDAGDSILDSGAFVDRLRAFSSPGGTCVAGANQPPQATDDTLTTAEDTPGSVNVMANDVELDAGQTLSIVNATNGAHGTVECALAGSCTYTPNPNYHGPDLFTYTVTDGHGGIDTATVNVTVTPVNDAPDPLDDVITTAAGTPGSANVLANDFDVDGDTLSITGFTQGAHGSVSCAGTNCTYTPNAGFSGSDSFTYTVSDGHGGSDTAAVAVTVTPPAVNHPPVAVDDTLETPEDTPKTINVLANDTDQDGDSLTVTTQTPDPLHGEVSCTAAGACTYTPDANYRGPDGFAYTVSDGKGGSDEGVVIVTVTSVNDAPNAVNDSLTVAEDNPGSLSVLANDTDVENSPLTVATLTPSAAHGTVSCTAAGVCTYTPNANYNGPDSFTYTAADNENATGTATVNVTVTPVNDAPVAVDDAFETAQNTAKSVNVLANDTDVDGDTLTVGDKTNGDHGTVSCTAAGACTYTPDADFTGPDSFTYTVSDGHGGSDVGSVSVTVIANHPPVAVDDKLTTVQEKTGSVNVRANDSDPDGDPLTVTAKTNGAHGSVSCSAAGVCTYTPAKGFKGSDSFTYTISDGRGGTDTATVKVTVAAKNRPPRCGEVHPTQLRLWPANHMFRLVKLVGATDPDGDKLTFKIAKVIQDERVKNVAGPNDVGPDAKRVAGHPNWIKLRAERDADENGRVYRIHYFVLDGKGGKCSGVERVIVPKRQGGGAVNSGRVVNSFKS